MPTIDPNAMTCSIKGQAMYLNEDEVDSLNIWFSNSRKQYQKQNNFFYQKHAFSN